MLEKELEAIGLNEKESKVYLASLELGQSTVQDIALKAGVNRATTYFIIEGLMSTGLMSSFHKGKKQFFIAADPDKLLEIIENQKREINRREQSLKKLIPQLQSVNNKIKERPVVRYYEGKEGIKTMVDELLKNATDFMYNIFSVDAVNTIFSENDKIKWRSTRIQRNVESRAIYTYKAGTLNNIPMSTSRRVPIEKFPITCDIAIYNDKVRIASLTNRLVGIVIEDKEIANSMKAIFELAWEAAEKYK